MKNLQQGFVGLVIAIIIGLVLIGGGTYVYLNKVNEQKGSSLSTTPTSNVSSVSITDPKDVTDFNTCMSYAKNIPTVFDIVFTHGSDIQEVTNFKADFQVAYPRATLKVSTEQDYLDEAIAYNGGSIKTPSAMADYKKMIMAQADSKISVTVPINDLGSLKDFSNFISATLNKYVHVKFQQYAGSSPETTLSSSTSAQQMQKYAEQQCDYKYNKLSASDRASSDIKNADSSIQLGVHSTQINALTYFDDHASYATGSLSLNNGICSDTGVYGLKKSLDSIAKIAGASYCYASSKEFAVSAPLKSDPTTGYCTDSTGFVGAVSSPMAASKGYCVTPKTVSQDISSCKNYGTTARERWICVGNIVDKTLQIDSIVAPYATPVSQKIDFCKTFSGIEADYCFSSIVKAGWGLNVDGSPDATAVCKMVSNQNPWFKNDCEER